MSMLVKIDRHGNPIQPSNSISDEVTNGVMRALGSQLPGQTVHIDVTMTQKDITVETHSPNGGWSRVEDRSRIVHVGVTSEIDVNAKARPARGSLPHWSEALLQKWSDEQV